MRTQSQLRTICHNLISGGRGWILLFIAFGWAISLGTRFIFPVAFPHFREEFNVRLSTLGLLYTLLWIAYALGQFPGGVLADRFGERNILASSTLLTALAVVIVAFSIDVVSLAAGMMLFGMTSALYGPTRFTILTDIYTEYDGTAVGLSQAAGQVGNTLLPIGTGLLAAYTSWRIGFFYVVPLFVLAAVGLWIVVPARTAGTASAVDNLSRKTVMYLVRNVLSAQTVKLTVLMALVMFALQGLTGFYPTYLVDVKGLSPELSATLYGAIFICAFFIQPVLGALGDLFEPRRTLLLVVGIQITALGLLTVATGVVQLTGVTILLSSFFGVGPIAITRLTNGLPADMKGAGLGFLRTGYFLVGATGSIVVGAFADFGLFNEAFLFLAGVMVVAFLLIISLPARSA